MSCATVTSIDGSLPVASWNDENRHGVLAIGRSGLQIQEVVLDGKFLLVGGIKVFLIFRWPLREDTQLMFFYPP